MTNREQHDRYNKSPKGRARQRAFDKRKRARLRAAGICLNCKTTAAVLGYVRCAECRALDQERHWLNGS